MEQKLPPLAPPSRKNAGTGLWEGHCCPKVLPIYTGLGSPLMSVLRNVRNQVLNVLNRQERHSKISPLSDYLISTLKKKFQL